MTLGVMSSLLKVYLLSYITETARDHCLPFGRTPIRKPQKKNLPGLLRRKRWRWDKKNEKINKTQHWPQDYFGKIMKADEK